jgi:methyl-accepting chemotaxis protein
MTRQWSFGQKTAGGFGAVVVLTLIISAIAIYALRGVVASKDRVLTVDMQNVVETYKLSVAASRKSVAHRGYLFSKEERLVDEMRERREQFKSSLRRLFAQVASDPETRRLLDDIERAENEHQVACDKTVNMRRGDANLDTIIHVSNDEVQPKRDALVKTIDVFTNHQAILAEAARQAASENATSAIQLVIVMTLLATALAAAIGFVLSRTLARQIGSAVQHVQSSSTELQAAANQQVAGAKESATAMSEITTTISELLATSRQIAESAQRVARIAAETGTAARAGDATVQKTNESVGSIKRQVDLIVTHMLDLGKKSQQIGGILEIINELAEQTNILAINATIEAAGAGDAGKRFGVVADEIRKLADRVGGSTKEIRNLIEEIRAAVNTTVMATEGGTKAVDAGTRQFGDVTRALEQISGLVGTTTEAAREIELSTKQQSTAVEQVNVAISNVAQATRETETSSGETLKTATQLSDLSRQLTALVQPSAAP